MHLFNILTRCTNDNYACAGIIGDTGIPGDLVRIIHYIYLAIQVVVPVVLIIFGMIELAKCLASQKEDEIKKAQGSLFRKLILAVLVFMVLSIVRFVFSFANSGNPNSETIWNCVNQIINGNCGVTVSSEFSFNCSGDNVVYNLRLRDATLFVTSETQHKSESAAQQYAAYQNNMVSQSSSQLAKDGKEISYKANGSKVIETVIYNKDHLSKRVDYNNKTKLMEWYGKQNDLVCK